MTPLFITGLARTGSSLLAHMLDAHPGINIAIDAFLPFYKSYRNALCGLEGDPPLGDYLYKDQDVLQKILASDLDISFNDNTLLKKLKARASDHAKDLAAEMYRIKGNTYKKRLDHALRLIAEIRGPAKYIGMKDVWVLEFFPAIRRSFPNAKFIVIVRDPRAGAASSNISPIDYARQWVKQSRLPTDMAQVVEYAQLVREPRMILDGICRYLEIPFDDHMLSPLNYIDHNTGGVWQGNSSFDTSIKIDPSRIDRWKKTLSHTEQQVINFICFGEGPGPDILQYYIDQSTTIWPWTNLGKPCGEFLNDWRRYENSRIHD